MRDAEIVESFIARSEQAIKETETKYGAFLNRLAMNILRRREDAEEVVNDTLLAAWNSIPPKNPENLKTYLGRIVRNKAVSRYRMTAAEKRGLGAGEWFAELDECLPSAQSAEDGLLTNELTAHITDWLRSLTDEERALFVRRYYYAESVSSLAKELSVPSKQLSRRLNRLREGLKKYLEGKGVYV